MAFDGKKHSLAYSTKREIYKAELDITKAAYLVLNPAWQYDDSTYAKRYDESYYFVGKCTPFRGYQLYPTRRYEVSADICADTLMVGDRYRQTCEGGVCNQRR